MNKDYANLFSMAKQENKLEDLSNCIFNMLKRQQKITGILTGICMGLLILVITLFFLFFGFYFG